MTATTDNNKRIAKNTLMLYARMLFTMAVSLYTSRVVLATLGVEDFGLYNVVGGFVAMFSFLNAAMASATQRFLNFELGRGDGERLRKVFCTSVNIHALIAATVLLLAETVGLWFVLTHLNIPADRMEAAMWVYQASIASTVVMVMSIPYNAAIIARERMGAFAYISVLETVLKLLIVYLLVVFSTDKLKLYAVLMLAVQLLIQVIYVRYSGSRFAETRYRPMWDGGLFREMTGFAGWSLFGNIAAVAFTQGLNVLLNMFFGPAVNAARGIAVQVQNAIRGFCINFQTALNPQITKSYAAGDMAYMHSLLFTSSKFSFYLLLILSLPVMLETPTILEWWLGIVPDHTVAFVRLTLAVSIIDSLANPLIQAASATGHIRKYQSVVGTMLIMILPISYAALKLGAPPEGVFVVQLVVFCIAHAARLWMLRPMIGFSLRAYFAKAVMPIACVTAVSLAVPVAAYCMMQPSAARFVVVCLLSVCSVAAAVWFVGLRPNERKFIMERMKIRKKAPSTPSVGELKLPSSAADSPTREELEGASVGVSAACCGCEACAQACPKGCITMREDGEGFAYPHVDTDKCVECGRCKDVCMLTKTPQKRKPIEVLAAKNRNGQDRAGSSSGGVFVALARKTIADGGVVFSAVFDEHWEVCHTETDNIDGVRPMMGSKYMQSRIGNAFRGVAERLKEGRKVLFVGTPCQVAGLRSYLRKDHDNLLAVDILCHGVPSVKAWRAYLEESFGTTRDANNITYVNFRDKSKEGWSRYNVVIRGVKSGSNENETELSASVYVENPYMKGFMADAYLRPSCHQCRSKEGASGSDLTIADYWGVDHLLPDFADDKGVSLVMTYTDKGRKALESLDIDTCPTTTKGAERHNGGFFSAQPAGPRRRNFFAAMEQGKGFSASLESAVPSNSPRGGKLVSLYRKVIKTSLRGKLAGLLPSLFNLKNKK